GRFDRLATRRGLAGEAILVHHGKFEIDVKIRVHRKAEHGTASFLLDLVEDPVSGPARARSDDEPAVPLVVAPIVVIDLPVFVDDLRYLLEAFLGGLDSRERRRSDHWGIQHRAEPSEDTHLAQALDSGERVVLTDTQFLSDRLKRPFTDRKPALKPIDQSGVDGIEVRPPVVRQRTHYTRSGPQNLR